MKKVVWAAVCAAFVASSLATGCKQIEEAKKAAAALKAAASAVAEAKGPPISSEEDKDAELGSKLGEYIFCMNNLSKRVVDSRNRYQSWIKDDTAGPTGKESVVYGVYEINTDSCYLALDRAAKATPPLPEIESAAAEYRKALDELQAVLKVAHKYYDQNDYKDDKMAQGKLLHPQLTSAFAKFEQVNKGFEERVITLNDQVNARQLVRLEKDPSRRLQYLSQRSLHDAKALIQLTDIAELKELDLQKFDVAFQTYDKALTELDQYGEAHKAEIGKLTWWSSYLGDCKEFAKSAKELLRRKRDNKDFNKEFLSSHSPQQVDGHPAQVIAKYNDMIDASNRLRY